MYSKQEARQVREDFWTFFGKRYDRKWLRYRTGIKDISLQFSFEDKRALVSIDMLHEDEVWRDYYYDKLVSLRSILEEEVAAAIVLDNSYLLENNKVIARAFVALDGVKIMRKSDWPQVYEFFYNTMDALEKFFLEYKDFIEQ